MSSKEKGEDLLAFVEELKRQWMATLDALVDPVMIVTPDYRVAKANLALARLAGRDVRTVVGRPCYEVFAKRSSPCSGCEMSEAAQTCRAKTFSLEGIRDHRYFEVTSQPIFSPAQKLEGVVQVYRDRTEAKLMEQRLHQNDKLASIGLLAGGVAHEINNPLGGILIFSQMLIRELPEDSPFRQDVVEIETAAKRCKAIVENLLDFARQRPVSSKSAKAEYTSMRDAVEGAMRLAQVNPYWRNIEVQQVWEGLDPLQKVVGSQNKLMQVFLNLMTNAVQAMPNGGVLEIVGLAAELPDGREGLAIEVRDSGHGISKAHLSRIFDPFFTTKDQGEGTGLGLAICYGIVEDLGGTIQVESVEGEGSTFRVILPVKTDKRQRRRPSRRGDRNSA